MEAGRRYWSRLEHVDRRVTTWMHLRSHRLERLAIGALFTWFGMNKLLGFKSATSIIAETVWTLGLPPSRSNVPLTITSAPSSSVSSVLTASVPSTVSTVPVPTIRRLGRCVGKILKEVIDE